MSEGFETGALPEQPEIGIVPETPEVRRFPPDMNELDIARFLEEQKRKDEERDREKPGLDS